MSVQDIQGSDEELVRVLLLVPRQVPRMSPHQVQQLVGDVGGAVPRVELLPETGGEGELSAGSTTHDKKNLLTTT